MCSSCANTKINYKVAENVAALSTKDLFGKVSDDTKPYLLSLLAHELTVYARGAYSGLTSDSEATEKLRVFNELQHTITGQLAQMLAGERDRRYPDDVFIDILYEQSRQADCEADLSCTFRRAFEYLSNNATA